MKFGDVCKKLRQERGLSVEELAQLTGMTRQSLSYYEAGKHNASLSAALRIVRSLKLSLSVFDGVTLIEDTRLHRGKQRKIPLRKIRAEGKISITTVREPG